MDTVSVTKTWVDFGFYVFDSIKDNLVPIIVSALAGWFTPSPQSVIRKLRGRV